MVFMSVLVKKGIEFVESLQCGLPKSTAQTAVMQLNFLFLSFISKIDSYAGIQGCPRVNVTLTQGRNFTQGSINVNIIEVIINFKGTLLAFILWYQKLLLAE